LYTSQQDLVSLQFNHENSQNNDNKQQKVANSGGKEGSNGISQQQNIAINNNTLPQQPSNIRGG